MRARPPPPLASRLIRSLAYSFVSYAGIFIPGESINKRHTVPLALNRADAQNLRISLLVRRNFALTRRRYRPYTASGD